MLFPMYTVAAETLVKMTKMEPHEQLKAENALRDRHEGHLSP